MDRLVALLVRLISALAGWAFALPGIEYATHTPGEPLKVLLVGYNGARNIGSDVRVATLARQLVGLMGADQVRVSVMTLDEHSTGVYFDDSVRQVPFGTLFFGALLKACSEHHVAILCEGSTFKSKFADALTLYSCEAAGVMRAQGKPCIAYGSEVGAMEAYLKRTMRHLCGDVRFAVRSLGSLEELYRLGFTGHLGTDTAWGFDSSPGHAQAVELLRTGGWDGKRPLLGIAPINPFCWPVKPSPFKLARAMASGNRSLQFQSWYFFSWSNERARRLEAYVEALVGACAAFAAERGFQPVVFGMEQLDAKACQMVAEGLGERLGGGPGGRVPVLLSSEHNGFVIAEALRSLDLLVTSRYHAQVLASEALVPTVAVSMDERLNNLAGELGCEHRLLLGVEDADLGPRLLLALDHACDNAPATRAQLELSVQAAKTRLDEMGRWLASQL